MRTLLYYVGVPGCLNQVHCANSDVGEGNSTKIFLRSAVKASNQKFYYLNKEIACSSTIYGTFFRLILSGIEPTTSSTSIHNANHCGKGNFFFWQIFVLINFPDNCLVSVWKLWNLNPSFNSQKYIVLNIMSRYIKNTFSSKSSDICLLASTVHSTNPLANLILILAQKN